MKALVYEGPQSIALRDVPDPVPADGDVLVKVEAVGICGSDMHAYLGHDERRPAPLILGHEAAGTIASGPFEGRRVTVNPLVSCGVCEHCRAGRENLCPHRRILSMPPREGAFCDYVSTPLANTVPVPDGVSFEKASLAEPLACGWHAVRVAERTLNQPLEETVCLVLGGGAIGFGSALVLRAFGASDITVIEPNDLRRPVLESAGFKVRGVDSFDGSPHLVVDAHGNAATRAMASRVVQPGGTIVHVGLSGGDAALDTRRMTLQEITFVGTYTYTPVDFTETAEAIFDGRLGDLDWPEIRPLHDGVQAFDAINRGAVAAPKVILKP